MNILPNNIKMIVRYVCKTCGKSYKVLTWFNRHIENLHHELDPIELLDNQTDIEFLKCEIKFLKRQMKELKSNGLCGPITNPIERIKQDEHRPERDQFKIEFNVVVKELKMIFRGDDFNYHDILQPITSLTTIEIPPLISSS